jgi:cobalt-zinc-cadmium efflux system outer membrane protein
MSAWLSLPLAANVALAATLPAPRAVTFDDAIGISQAAPEVRGAERAVEVKHEMRGRISTMTQNPQIYLQPGLRVLPVENKGMELQASIAQSWNLSGLSSARKKAAHAEEAVLAAEARVAALSRRLGAARAWVDLWAAQRVLEVAQREAALAGEFARLVEKAAAASAATKADAADARAYHAEARLSVIAAEGEVFERGIDLARAIAAGPSPLAVQGDLPVPALPERGTWDGTLKRVQALPQVRRAALAAEAERAREAEEHAARGTLLSLGAYIQHDQPGGFVGYGMATLTLPVFDRGERERSVTVARAAQLDGEKQKEAIDAASDMVMAMHEVEHTQEVVDALQNEILPALDEGLAARVRIFQAGEGTILEVVQTRRNAAAARSRMERARAAHAWAQVKVWLLFAAMEEAEDKAAKENAR